MPPEEQNVVVPTDEDAFAEAFAEATEVAPAAPAEGPNRGAGDQLVRPARRARLSSLPRALRCRASTTTTRRGHL